MSDSYLIGIDVGSAEVRCGLVTDKGEVVRVETQKIEVFSPAPGYFQQSSNQIWDTIVQLIRKLTYGSDVINKIKGIGCDATCSLVVVGERNQPVSVSPKGEEEQNIIMWMDHRAGEQAELINKLGHPLLQYLGGKVSLEMQMPKLIWLKQNMPHTYQKAQHFFDLPDFLTWKLTGEDTRSQCSLVCKWMFEGSPNSKTGWNQAFLKSIDLEELSNEGFKKIGSKVAMPGQRIGCLSPETAEELGLHTNVFVGASLIDAHAGTIGLIGTKWPSTSKEILISNKIGMICGTSSCFMLLSEKGVQVDGVWGPYYGVALENLWLSEGGQSAAGQLLDSLVSRHPSKPSASAEPATVCSVITKTLLKMASNKSCPLQLLTKHFHIYPDFRGNRSPLADPSLRGMISGLDISSDEEQLSLIYLSAIQALSYSARQTIEKLESKGLGPVKCLVICGGLSRNKLFVETLAGALSRPVLIPSTSEAVILGSAMLGAAAANIYTSLTDCALKMSSNGSVVQETDEGIIRYHDKKYKVYLKMQADQLEYKDIMLEK